MDHFFHYRNPNFQSSSILLPNTKCSNTFHGNQSEKKKNKIRNNNKIMTRKVKLSTDPQSVAARERRHRITEKLKILRSLIPGGDTRNLDTVSMLEEVIQYVKYLKSQVWLHQTMISFENFDDYNHCDQYPHQDLHTSDHHFYGDHHNQYEMLPQLGFAEESSFKVEDEDYNYMVSLFHDHHHRAVYP